MSQTSIIAGSLIVAFIVFVTVRGELPCYLEVLGVSSGGGCNVSQPTITGAIVDAGKSIWNTITGGVSGFSSIPTGSGGGAVNTGDPANPPALKIS